jgi:hypothetical protein
LYPVCAAWAIFAAKGRDGVLQTVDKPVDFSDESTFSAQGRLAKKRVFR